MKMLLPVHRNGTLMCSALSTRAMSVKSQVSS